MHEEKEKDCRETIGKILDRGSFTFETNDN